MLMLMSSVNQPLEREREREKKNGCQQTTNCVVIGFTGFVPFFINDFPGLFQDFSRTQIDFSRDLKFTLIPALPRSQC